jgi:hypothetical protein
MAPETFMEAFLLGAESSHLAEEVLHPLQKRCIVSRTNVR